MHTAGREAYNGKLVIPAMSFQLRCGCVGSSNRYPSNRTQSHCAPTEAINEPCDTTSFHLHPSHTHMKLITACCLLAANLGVN